jgi:hypothetical protein
MSRASRDAGLRRGGAWSNRTGDGGRLPGACCARTPIGVERPGCGRPSFERAGRRGWRNRQRPDGCAAGRGPGRGNRDHMVPSGASAAGRGGGRARSRCRCWRGRRCCGGRSPARMGLGPVGRRRSGPWGGCCTRRSGAVVERLLQLSGRPLAVRAAAVAVDGRGIGLSAGSVAGPIPAAGPTALARRAVSPGTVAMTMPRSARSVIAARAHQTVAMPRSAAVLRELSGWPSTIGTSTARPSGVSVAVTIPHGSGDADADAAERQQQGEGTCELPRLLSRGGLPERSRLSLSAQAQRSLPPSHRPY